MNLPRTVNWKIPKTVAGVLLTLSLLSLEITQNSVQALQRRLVKSSSSATRTYVYGETPQSNQIRKDYLVFTRQNNKVVGAFYSPHSQFECFTGFLEKNTLDVSSVGSGEAKIAKVKVNLSEFYPIQTISSNEQRILSACEKLTVALANRQSAQLFSLL